MDSNKELKGGCTATAMASKLKTLVIYIKGLGHVRTYIGL